MSNNVSVIVIGAGYMGKEHTKVLLSLGITPTVVCRAQKSATIFEEEMGIKPLIGGVDAAVSNLGTIPTHAVVAVNVEQLAPVTMSLMEFGVKQILVEKPAALNREELESLCAAAKEKGVDIFVAYNRRFYSSTEKALEIITEDGGVSSYYFEFSEWGFRIETTGHAQEVKDEWLKANSSHVIDLAFFLGGEPEEMYTFVSGDLTWSSLPSKYAGAGKTKNGVLFSYQANWDAPGRWVVEILTSEHRLYFKPMEELKIQNKGSVNVENVYIDNQLDVDYKPGLYHQMRAFLFGDKKERLVSIEEQLKHIALYEKIEGNN